MSLLKSALNRTRVENPMVFWGTAAMTMFAVVRMVIGEEGVTAAPSSPAATGPARGSVGISTLIHAKGI